VDMAMLDEVLASDGFGKFAVLSASEEVFIQAANDWEPADAWRAFLAAHDSDPWVLEYREGGRQFRAVGRSRWNRCGRRSARTSLMARSGAPGSNGASWSCERRRPNPCSWAERRCGSRTTTT
jgi:hypothetical protein